VRPPTTLGDLTCSRLPRTRRSKVECLSSDGALALRDGDALSYIGWLLLAMPARYPAYGTYEMRCFQRVDVLYFQ
jgi:hypothetical protein